MESLWVWPLCLASFNYRNVFKVQFVACIIIPVPFYSWYSIVSLHFIHLSGDGLALFLLFGHCDWLLLSALCTRLSVPVFTCLGCISKSGIAGMVTLFTFLENCTVFHCSLILIIVVLLPKCLSSLPLKLFKWSQMPFYKFHLLYDQLV